MEQQKRRVECMCLCFFLMMVLVGRVKGADLEEKCSQFVQKVIPCLSFATGKAAVPTKECCDASSQIKESNPECLCYVIQQTHKGSPEVKSMGIQEAKLLQLPDACNLKNASITNCPKLLGLSPSSPDAAMFTHASSKTSPASTTGTSISSQSQNDSYGRMLRPSLIANLMVVAFAVFLVVIPTRFVRIHSGWMVE